MTMRQKSIGPLLLVIAAFCVQIRSVQVPLTTPKRIAVVGAGAGGLAALQALVQLPQHMRVGWEIVVFERREGIGGVWLPDFNPPAPPALPQSPLYPGLRTNCLHVQMTTPHVPFPPETPLVARHADVLRYHQSVVDTFGLARYIKLRHVVESASWIGSAWKVTVKDLTVNTTRQFSFDHIIAAPGYNAFPVVPSIPGQDEWLAADTSRLLSHCMWYRDPTIYSGKIVAVVGGGPSGWDMVLKIHPHASAVYWNRDTKEDNPAAPRFPPVPGVPDVRRAARLYANGSMLLADGQMLPRIDAIVLGTGYATRIPFLTAGGHLAEQDTQSEHLTTNGRYMHPLFEHTLSLDTSYPLGALYLGGVLVYNPTGMTSFAQGLFAAYTIARPELLHSREKLLDLLQEREDRVRAEGFEPSRVGHKWGHGYGAFFGFDDDGSFEDLLVNYLRDSSNGTLAGYPGIPPTGQNYTERWRLWTMRHSEDIYYAWDAGLELEGEEAWNLRWSAGRVSEADYVDEMHGIAEWWEGRREGEKYGNVSSRWL